MVIPQKITMVFWGSTVPWYSIYHGTVLAQNTTVNLYHGILGQYSTMVYFVPWYSTGPKYHGTNLP